MVKFNRGFFKMKTVLNTIDSNKTKLLESTLKGISFFLGIYQDSVGLNKNLKPIPIKQHSDPKFKARR